MAGLWMWDLDFDWYVCNGWCVRYRWEKNGKEFNWQVYDNRISRQPGRGTLVITQPTTEDIGEPCGIMQLLKFWNILIISTISLPSTVVR